MVYQPNDMHKFEKEYWCNKVEQSIQTVTYGCKEQRQSDNHATPKLSETALSCVACAKDDCTVRKMARAEIKQKLLT